MVHFRIILRLILNKYVILQKLNAILEQYVIIQKRSHCIYHKTAARIKADRGGSDVGEHDEDEEIH